MLKSEQLKLPRKGCMYLMKVGNILFIVKLVQFQELNA